MRTHSRTRLSPRLRMAVAALLVAAVVTDAAAGPRVGVPAAGAYDPVPFQALFALAEAPRLASPVERLPASIHRALNALPADAVTVRDVTAGDDRVVFLIRDVHENAEGQRRVADAVRALILAIPDAALGLEGLAHDLALERDADPWRASRARAARFWFDRGDLGGAVYAAITATATRVFGLERADLYDANVAAFRDAAPLRGKRLFEIEKRRAALDERAAEADPHLQSFLAFLRAYEGGAVPLDRYIRRIGGDSLARYPALADFIEAADLEAGLKRDRIRAEIERLLARDGARAADLDSAILAERIAAAAREPERYPGIAHLFSYRSAAARLNGEAIMREAADARAAHLARLARSADDRRLAAESEALRLAAGLVRFSLSRDEWRRWRSARSSLAGVGDLAPFEAFYRRATERDAAMAERALTAVNRSAARAAIIVAGGFHAGGITRRLAEDGIAVVDLVPALTRVPAGSADAHLTPFLRKKTPLERLFAGARLFLAAPPWSAAHEFRLRAAAVADASFRNPDVDLLVESRRRLRRAGFELDAITVGHDRSVVSGRRGHATLSLHFAMSENDIADVEVVVKAGATFIGILQDAIASGRERIRDVIETIRSMPDRLANALSPVTGPILAMEAVGSYEAVSAHASPAPPSIAGKERPGGSEPSWHPSETVDKLIAELPGREGAAIGNILRRHGFRTIFEVYTTPRATWERILGIGAHRLNLIKVTLARNGFFLQGSEDVHPALATEIRPGRFVIAQELHALIAAVDSDWERVMEHLIADHLRHPRRRSHDWGTFHRMFIAPGTRDGGAAYVSGYADELQQAVMTAAVQAALPDDIPPADLERQIRYLLQPGNILVAQSDLARPERFAHTLGHEEFHRAWWHLHLIAPERIDALNDLYLRLNLAADRLPLLDEERRQLRAFGVSGRSVGDAFRTLARIDYPGYDGTEFFANAFDTFRGGGSLNSGRVAAAFLVRAFQRRRRDDAIDALRRAIGAIGETALREAQLDMDAAGRKRLFPSSLLFLALTSKWIGLNDTRAVKMASMAGAAVEGAAIGLALIHAAPWSQVAAGLAFVIAHLVLESAGGLDARAGPARHPAPWRSAISHAAVFGVYAAACAIAPAAWGITAAIAVHLGVDWVRLFPRPAAIVKRRFERLLQTENARTLRLLDHFSRQEIETILFPDLPPPTWEEVESGRSADVNRLRLRALYAHVQEALASTYADILSAFADQPITAPALNLAFLSRHDRINALHRRLKSIRSELALIDPVEGNAGREIFVQLRAEQGSHDRGLCVISTQALRHALERTGLDRQRNATLLPVPMPGVEDPFHVFILLNVDDDGSGAPGIVALDPTYGQFMTGVDALVVAAPADEHYRRVRRFQSAAMEDPAVRNAHLRRYVRTAYEHDRLRARLASLPRTRPEPGLPTPAPADTPETARAKRFVALLAETVLGTLDERKLDDFLGEVAAIERNPGDDPEATMNALAGARDLMFFHGADRAARAALDDRIRAAVMRMRNATSPSYRLPRRLWRPFKAALRRRFGDDHPLYRRIVGDGAGIARTNGEDIVIEEEALPALVSVLNERLRRERPVSIDDVRAHLFFHERLHRIFHSRPAFFERLFASFESFKATALGAEMVPGLVAMFERNFGETAGERGFLEEFIVAQITEQVLLGQPLTGIERNHIGSSPEPSAFPRRFRHLAFAWFQNADLETSQPTVRPDVDALARAVDPYRSDDPMRKWMWDDPRDWLAARGRHARQMVIDFNVSEAFLMVFERPRSHQTLLNLLDDALRNGFRRWLFIETPPGAEALMDWAILTKRVPGESEFQASLVNWLTSPRYTPPTDAFDIDPDAIPPRLAGVLWFLDELKHRQTTDAVELIVPDRDTGWSSPLRLDDGEKTLFIGTVDDVAALQGRQATPSPAALVAVKIVASTVHDDGTGLAPLSLVAFAAERQAERYGNQGWAANRLVGIPGERILAAAELFDRPGAPMLPFLYLTIDGMRYNGVFVVSNRDDGGGRRDDPLAVPGEEPQAPWRDPDPADREPALTPAGPGLNAFPNGVLNINAIDGSAGIGVPARPATAASSFDRLSRPLGRRIQTLRSRIYRRQS